MVQSAQTIGWFSFPIQKSGSQWLYITRLNGFDCAWFSSYGLEFLRVGVVYLYFFIQLFSPFIAVFIL